MFRENLRMSWQQIISNKMRSFLTVLGIVIGIGAIITLITVVSGVTDTVMGEFVSLGSDKLSITARGTPYKQGLTDNDLERLSTVELVNGLSPTVSTTSDIIIGGKLVEKATILGRNHTYFQYANDGFMLKGRQFNPLDIAQKAKVCIIDNDLAEEYYFGKDPLGEKIMIGGTAYTIVGITGEVQSMQEFLTRGDVNILLPYKNALNMQGSKGITSLDVYMADSSRSSEIIDSISALLDQAFNYKENSYSILNLENMLEIMDNIEGMMQTMLVAIASIALLVGGIGIMNMMLVSVTERTREIGLRKALGAKPSQIQMQFLMEAILLSLLGGVFGILMGVGASFLFAVLLDITITLSVDAIMIGVGFSAAVGIIFGIAPARKASRLNPIDALRDM